MKLSKIAIAHFCNKILRLSKVGLKYSDNEYDAERYKTFQKDSLKLLTQIRKTKSNEIQQLITGDIDYQTPKVGIAAAIFDKNDRLLLIQRKDNQLWAMPGGWAEVGELPSRVAERETLEEAGLQVKAIEVMGIYDSYKHKFTNQNHIYHIVFLCKKIKGSLKIGQEQLNIGFFAKDNLPILSPGHSDAIKNAYQWYKKKQRKTIFD